MKVVFITHRADRSGAPLYLLEIIRQFKLMFPDFDLTILTLYDGVLVSDFQELGKVIVLNRFEHKFLKKFKYNRFTKALKLNKLSKINFEFAYANSSCTWLFYQNHIKAEKTYFHLHELKRTFDFCMSDSDSKLLDFSGIDRLLCVSKEVKNFIYNEISTLDPSIIEIVPGFYKEESVPTKSTENQKIIIGSLGQRTDMKGFGIFKTVAEEFTEQENVHFMWIGGYKNDKCENIPSNLSLISHTTNVKDYYRLLDVFCLLSEEDSFPLAVLEVSRYNIPLICYNKYNGVSEIIAQSKAGIVTEYLSVENIVDAVRELIYNEQMRIEMGTNCKKAFSKYTIENTMDILINLMKIDKII